MAITQDDFKKVWASTSSVPKYTFSDTDYKNGWEFVGNLPPTRAMWDELQRKNDEKMQFLQENGSMCFDSVTDMKSSNLDAGQTTFTKGYYSINDGGSSVYAIRAKTQEDVDDGEDIIFLDNGNVAERITSEVEVNPMKIDKNANVYDDANIFTLATYNTQGMNYWRYPPNPPCATYQALVSLTRVIQSVNPDIIGMNEACASAKYDSVGNILYSTGYPYSHFAGGYGKTGTFQNSKLGNALFSRFPFESIEDTEWSDYATGRYFTHATFSINNKKLSVYCTHLDLNAERRATQITDILNALSNDTNPYKVVIGDLNLTYQSTEYQRFIDAGLVNTNGDKPTLNQSIIDFILRTPNIDVVTYDVIQDTFASDHNMLWAKLRLE